MISLFKLHWQFIRRPSSALEQHIPSWPLKYGVILYILYFSSTFFENTTFLRLTSDILGGFWGLPGTGYVYLFLVVTQLYNVLLQYHLQPHIVRWVAKIPRENYQPDLFRRLVFYSPTAGVIYTVLVILPVQILSAALVVDGSMAISSLVLIGFTGFLGLWGIVTTVNTFVIQWKGLAKFFNMSTGQIILAEFIIPLILAMPCILLYGSGYITFMQKYAQ